MKKQLNQRWYQRVLKNQNRRKRKQLSQRANQPTTMQNTSCWSGLETLEPRLLLSGEPGLLDDPTTTGHEPAVEVQVVTSQADQTTSPTAVGESGTVTVNQKNARQWHNVVLKRKYVDPVVVMGPLSVNGGQPSTVRVRNVTQSGFQWQIDEWDYLDGRHVTETVGYLVVESGTHTLEDGTKVVAGKTSTDHTFQSVDLPSFSSAPIVLAQVSTVEGGSAVVTRLKNVQSDGFEVRVQEEEGNDGRHRKETVGYVAIDSGIGATGDGVTFEAARTRDAVTHRSHSISFTEDFTDTPVFLAATQTADGNDPAGLRYENLDSDSVSFFIEEEQSANDEILHTTEVVGYLAIDSGLINAHTDANDPQNDGVVLRAGGDLVFGGENDDYMQIDHKPALELAQGTVSFSFVADDVDGSHAVFSKDASGQIDAGHLTTWVRNGRLKVRLQSNDAQVILDTASDSIVAGKRYHAAITFGNDGFWLYLDGQMKDWDLEFKQNLVTNKRELAIGASLAERTDEHPNHAKYEFDGVISDFTIYNTQFNQQQVAQLAGHEIDPPLQNPTVINGVLHGTLGNDNPLDAAAHNVHAVFGNYGDDLIIANPNKGTVPGHSPSESLTLKDYANALNGGHGRDTLQGGDQNDLLISRADGREPKIAQTWNAEDDPYGEINKQSNTHYVDQPIEADDTLTGGKGADTFYFQTLINAKRHIILKHVRDDGTINWGTNGVAGENDNVHDHWVERLGDELITDFDRQEGDHILIEGHTTEVYNVEYIDSDGDNNLDSTVLHVWSNQANGGAHDEDSLGTITVAGALLNASDYTVNKVDYGIVPTVAQLDEALAPYTSIPDDEMGPVIPAVDDGSKIDGVVLRAGGDLVFSGENDDYMQIDHKPALELAQGTVSFSFVADDVDGSHAVFSKDASGQIDAGHLTTWVRNGRLKVRLQSNDAQVILDTASDSIVAGKRYHAAITFGNDGFWLYLDGQMKDWDLEFKQNLVTNKRELAIGASLAERTDEHPNHAKYEFDGVISDFTIYNTQFNQQQVAQLAGHEIDPPLQNPTVINGVLHGTLGNDNPLDAAAHNVHAVFGNYGDDLIIANPNKGTVPGHSPSESLTLKDYANALNGGHGRDTLQGGDQNDLLISRADGREPKIAQTWNAEDDPYGEINKQSNTHYVDQPIEADDTLTGGKGADTFYFQTLINAKRHIILKHVRDDGTINWGTNGVAGENDNVHDHWVERLGDELITDFDRQEGDHILIEGHTTEVYNVEYIDSDGDNNLDSTVLHVWSNQANGGAHDEDSLGTITVAGALLNASDYTVNKVDYGIVPTVAQLDEALAPYTSIPDDEMGPVIPAVDDGSKIDGVVLRAGGDLVFSGENDDYMQIDHKPALELAQGTVSFSFVADDVDGSHAVFSKDASGQIDAGHLTTWVRNGRLKVRLQSNDAQVILDTASDSIVAGKRYHAAITFGNDGFWLYLDGQMKDWDLEFKQNLVTNKRELAIGASLAERTDEHPNHAKYEFDGVISDFTIYNTQFNQQQVAQLAGHEIDPPLQNPTVINGVLHGTLGNDNPLDAAAHNVHAVFGNYGDDLIIANPNKGTVPGHSPSESLTLKDYANALNGGHGRDTLQGGDQNDLLISRADGREPKIAQTWNAEDDPYGEINKQSNTHYVDQPIEADDTLTGGKGADTFYFQTLINAKRHIILKHVRDDGTINWGTNGVAGENDNVHDHWVERLGDELITDFDRQEGDHILIEGHTTEIYNVEYIDSDGDNNLDSTVLHVWSNQANGGAHDEDSLGTITVAGALLNASDYTVNKVDYGIVPTVAQLDEALAPYTSIPDDEMGPVIPAVDDGSKIDGVVLRAGGDLVFSGENDDYMQIDHKPALELTQGTVSFSFVADDVDGSHAVFSKDASGQIDAGHLTTWVRNGRLKVRLQSNDAQVILDTASDSIVAGKRYHAAITFGNDGFWLYLDGQMKDWDLEFKQNLVTNKRELAIGASLAERTDEHPNHAKYEFDGVISDFTIYNTQFSQQQVAQLAGHEIDPASNML